MSGQTPVVCPDPNYLTTIPAEACEEVTERFDNGRVSRAEYFLADQLVGRRSFNPNGTLEEEHAYREQLEHGWQYYFRGDESGWLHWAEPRENGKIHGTALQWDQEDGRLLGTYSLEHGTGFDLWRQRSFEDGIVCLAEVHPMLDGDPHGFEWWLCEDGTIYQETAWNLGEYHGINRRWNNDGKLERGYPRYYVDGIRVTRRQYLKACAKDPTLPPFRPEDNLPVRDFPPEIQRVLKGMPQD